MTDQQWPGLSCLDVLRPDPGWQVESAILATYSADLVAIVWIGRGSHSADEFADARTTARSENTVPTAEYLLGVPLLADYIEDGLDKLGIERPTI